MGISYRILGYTRPIVTKVGKGLPRYALVCSAEQPRVMGQAVPMLPLGPREVMQLAQGCTDWNSWLRFSKNYASVSFVPQLEPATSQRKEWRLDSRSLSCQFFQSLEVGGSLQQEVTLPGLISSSPGHWQACV